MMAVAGVSLIIGSVCVFFIKEGTGDNGRTLESPKENPVESENI